MGDSGVQIKSSIRRPDGVLFNLISPDGAPIGPSMVSYMGHNVTLVVPTGALSKLLEEGENWQSLIQRLSVQGCRGGAQSKLLPARLSLLHVSLVERVAPSTRS